MATSNRQVTININAVTSEFQESMNKARSSVTLINSALKLNSSELKNDSTNTSLLKDRLVLLNEKLEEEHSLTENLQNALQEATELYGDDSEEVQNLTKQLNYQKTAEQAVKNEIENVTTKLKSAEQELKDNQTAHEKLTSKIEEQTEELKELKDKYSDVILEEGENSDSAQDLRKQMEELNDELKENKTKLADAESSSDDFTDALDDLNDNVDDSQDGFTVFKGALADLVSDGIQSAVSAVKELASEIVDLGTTFSSSLSKVEALSGASEEEMELIEDTARELGSTTKYTASEVAEGFQYMALAGWDTSDMVESMASVLNLAIAGEMDLADASDIVTDYLTAFGLSAEDSSGFVDQLAYAMSNSNTTVDQLGEAYKNCAATSTQLGYSLEDTTAALMVMADSGIKGSEAGTALSSIMTRLGNNTSGCADLLAEYGIEVYDAEGNTKSLSSILTSMQSVWSDLTDEEKSNLAYTVAGKTAQTELMTVLGESTGSFDAYKEGLENCTGAAEEMANVMSDNLEGDTTKLNSALETLGLSIFDSFESPLRSVTQFITNNVISVLSDFNEDTGALSVVLAGVAAALGVLAGALAISGIIASVQKAFALLNTTLLANPIVLVVAAIAALIAIFVTLWNNCESFRNFWKALWNEIKELVQPAIDFIKEVWDTIAPYFEAVWEKIKEIFSVVGEVIGGFFSTAWDNVKIVWDTFKSYFQAIFNTLSNIFSGVKALFSGDFSGAWEAVKNIFSTWSEFFSGLWESIKSIFSNVGEFFSNIFTSAFDKVKEIFNNVVTFVSEKFTAIKDTLVSFGTKVGDSISSAIKSAINWVLEKVEGVLNTPINAINGLLDIINAIPGINLSKLSTFSLPRLKSGMSYVPNDYYPAYLDEGERVLTKEENAVYNRVGGMVGLLNNQLSTNVNSSNSYFDSMLEYLEIIAQKDTSLYIDSQELAKATGTANDEVNGEIVALKERGLEI